MKIILLSKYKFLISEVSKLNNIYEIKYIKEIDDIFNYIIKDENFILLHHLDNIDDYYYEYKMLIDNFSNYKLIALRNATNNIEGCSVLKKNYKSYMNSMSNYKIIKDSIETVRDGKNWIYPELMQFLISSIPINDKSQDKILKKITIKELEVLELLSQGESNLSIANILNIAEVTVKKHISAMFKKLEVTDRLTLALYFKK